MGTANSKPSGKALGDASPQQQKQPSDEAVAPCPLGFDKMLGTSDDNAGDSATSSSADATARTMPASHPPTSGSSASCPMHKLLPGGGSSAGDPGAAAAVPAGNGSASTSSSSCPVKEENRSKVSKYLHPHKYNVYSQRIDEKGLNPTNNMPANPNQQPAPGQEKPLSTARVPSTIPKGGEESTWTYPSPQMFWNALTRKGKAENTGEEDMDVVVSIHNNMNERTWKKILEWEKIRSRGGGEGGEGEEGSEPRLLRFLGRPDDTSPKALAKMMLGHPLPFDRHDWVVDRGGDERRYVIDYYYDDGAVDEDGMPALHAEGAVKSIKVDVRPALDGFRDLADRLVQMPLARLTGKSEFVPLGLRPSPTMKAREPWAKLRTKKGLPSSTPLPGTASKSERDSAATAAAGGSASLGPDTTAADRDARAMARAEKKCAKKFYLLREVEGAGDALRAEAAALSLEYCTARYLCKKEARAYKEALECAGPSGSIIGNDPAHAYWAESALDKRLGEMRGALTAFAQRQLEARRRQSEEK